MKQRVIDPSRDNIKITTKQPEQEAFDVSARETVTKEDIQNAFATMFDKHKEKVLNLVTSRIALDSVIVSVEKGLAETNNGSPIKLQEADLSEKLDAVFDRALVIYAFESALSEVLTDSETRREFILKYVDSHPSFINPPKEKAPLGVATSRDPEKIANRAIEDIKKMIEGKTGLKDDAPSPYGRSKQEVQEKPSGKLPKNAGVVTRKVRRTTSGNGKRHGNG